MLTIHFDDTDGVVYNTSVYFNNAYSSEWFNDPFAQKMIAAIDRGIVLGPNAIETKILGVIPPEKLSSGLKTLLLMNFLPDAFTMLRTAAITALVGFKPLLRGGTSRLTSII